MKAEQLIKLNASVGTITNGHEHICSEDQRITDFSLSSGERKSINFEQGLKSSFMGVLKAVACNDQDKNLKQAQEDLLSLSFLKGHKGKDHPVRYPYLQPIQLILQEVLSEYFQNHNSGVYTAYHVSNSPRD